ncbi:Zn-ribbon domain-containing OB-fold protein [Rhabdothermincola sediminis]|uniref:Zn-ribbon domain-containing OB-fold protein n=1 Tax=Rhabdothermincola sediminis TaxID=2751370 RepID=UPI001AA049F1|nr:Zn-ribbon domain-containing OB-fold protein [Rhabdothermincola sediminis]
MASPRFDLPTIESDTRPFWDAVREGKLLLRSCNRCGAVHYYPRPFCPSCWSEDVTWVEASGRGTVYTYSTVYRNDLPPFNEQLPYVVAIVELEEGPRMMTRLVDTDGVELAVGMPVIADFTALTDDVSIVVFRPA